MPLARRLWVSVASAGAVVLTTMPAHAQIGEETAFVLNSLSFLMHGFLVMFMAAGFAMLESGLVRMKNTAAICLKNVALYAVAGLVFYLTGYNLMYDGVDGGFIGSFGPWSADDAAALAGDFSGGYAAASDWFFQMVFVATTASIVSGAVAERIRLWPFLIFTGLLAGLVYPITGAWQWGGGWLAELGFVDFAGSTLVHSVGGWAALTGTVLLGARTGKYGPGGRINPMPGANLPLSTLGTFILWVGWFGFNGGSQLALGSAADAIAMATIYVNTNMAAVGGVLSAMALTQALHGKLDLTMALNGAIAGLVSITAGPDTPTPLLAAAIGAVGGALVVFAVPMFDRLRIDDVVGAISVHLVCGIWGTLAVPLSNPEASLLVQLVGVIAVGAFATTTTTGGWILLRRSVGLRCSEEAELIGLDRAELGLEAYPEFGRGSQTV